MIFKVSKDPQKLKYLLNRVAALLRDHKVGAIPTETFYALACDPFSEIALERLFKLKKRSPDKPILLLLGKMEDLSLVVAEVSDLAKRLMEIFWPGPLTIVMPAKRDLPKLLTAGLNTIGVRLSPCELTRQIALAFGKPVTGTSANISGSPPCREPEEILRFFPNIDFVVDGGRSEATLPSTVVEIKDKEIKLVREGAIPFREILAKIEGDRP